MSLLEVQKAERRQRILSEARTLVTERGWDGLTMRNLAEQSRVSVPTVYNLIGGKDALLDALMECLFLEVKDSIEDEDGDVVTRSRALWRAGLAPFIAAPEYSRELMCLFLSGAGGAELRRAQDARYTALVIELVQEGMDAGALLDIVDAEQLAWTMYTQWISQVIRWARQDIGLDQMIRDIDRGLCLLLLGVTTGEAHAGVVELLKQSATATVPFHSPAHASSDALVQRQER
ncbi:MAG: TetR/AcrR family transcriptional regulator [Polyangiales bacterium]